MDIIDYGVNSLAPTGIVIEPPPDTSITIRGKLRIVPADKTVQVQNFLQFNAHIVDSNDVTHDTNADWFVKRDRVGPISDDGLLFAYFPGKANIMAKCYTTTTKTSLSVIDTTEDSRGKNKVSIVRNFPNDKEKKPKTINEGEMFVLSGIKHPYNILNGAAVYFPKGSLHEDITIEVKIPKFAKIKEDSVVFANEIVNGIELNVFVNDLITKPYYFDKPVSIALPFKRGILRRYGINVSNLGLFFAHDSVTFNSIGIKYVMIDSSHNRIYGLVKHFSSLIVRENKIVTPIKASGEISVTPVHFVLRQNYPNPFNPETNIQFQIPQNSNVLIKIFNTVGQEIKTLTNNFYPAGSHSVRWDGRDSFGNQVPSGLYFYHIKAGNFNSSRKLLLMK
jgi:hypothetical protein